MGLASKEEQKTVSRKANSSVDVLINNSFVYLSKQWFELFVMWSALGTGRQVGQRYDWDRIRFIMAKEYFASVPFKGFFLTKKEGALQMNRKRF